jgi:hypothetical protein
MCGIRTADHTAEEPTDLEILDTQQKNINRK